MPGTRSKGPAQPTLPFPRRKSCRSVSSKAAAPAPQEEESLPYCPKDLTPLPRGLVSIRLGPTSQRPPTPLSPRLSPRLPLSPRKRTGDDNVCNLGSPPKQGRRFAPAAASPRKLCFDENSPLSAPPPQKLSPSAGGPSSPGRPDQLSGPRSPGPVCQGGPRRLADKSRYQAVKRALHTAIPERLLSRETERAAIRSFLEERVLGGAPASLYVSGAPGTGKTACFSCVLQEMKEELAEVQTVTVNCMTLRSSHAIFPLLAARLGLAGGHSSGSRLQKLLTSAGRPVLLVLDEMDQLDSKAQDVLYTIFEWPYLPESRLCLVGIANALDLTDRILPRLQALPRCRPQLLHFPPYSREELTAIVQDRLSQASGAGLLDPSAVQFCAGKVSAVSGDARKALDICRRAVEIVEADDRKKAAEDPAGGRAVRVSVPQVARVLSEVYGDRMEASGGGGEGESFPLQQKLLVCCLLLLTRHGKSKEVPLGKLQEVYCRLCARRQVGAVGQGECLSLCTLLESRGIFSLRKAKEARLTKVFLKIEERVVENALKDRTLLGSILEEGLP